MSTHTPPKILVIPFDRAARYPELDRIGHRDVLDRWRATDRSTHSPRLVAVLDREGDDWTGAALVTARPHTAYLKIVDVVGDVPVVVDGVVEYARNRGVVQVKWEGWNTESDLIATGFIPLEAPIAEETLEPERAYVRWIADVEVSEPRYYRQTTHFTCGAVTALIAQSRAAGAGATPIDRTAELTLWREATNFFACEPVGLGVAMGRRWPDARVTIVLDTIDPVMLGSFAEGERGWRSDLQRASREEAASLGIPIDENRISVSDIREALSAGESVLLLITLDAMLGIDVPHWVLCHGTVSGAIVIEDPWVSDNIGETWVDSHLLPVHDSALDEMSLIEGARYRGAVRIGNSS